MMMMMPRYGLRVKAIFHSMQHQCSDPHSDHAEHKSDKFTRGLIIHLISCQKEKEKEWAKAESIILNNELSFFSLLNKA